MSTNACIARPAGDGWEGRYHHWDGYPTGLGAFLVSEAYDQLGQDHERLARVLIDGESVGWSIIIGSDLTKPKRWVDSGDTSEGGPLSYEARGDKPDEWATLTCTCPGESERCGRGGIEWAYVVQARGVAVYAQRSDGSGWHYLAGFVAWGDTAAMEVIESTVYAVPA